MQTVSHVTFRDETVCLDETHFLDCHLLNCVLEYSGKELRFERTEFTGCRLKLNAEAGRTLSLLQCLGYLEGDISQWLQLAEEAPEAVVRLN